MSEPLTLIAAKTVRLAQALRERRIVPACAEVDGMDLALALLVLGEAAHKAPLFEPTRMLVSAARHMAVAKEADEFDAWKKVAVALETLVRREAKKAASCIAPASAVRDAMSEKCMTTVCKETFPQLHLAFRKIELDNGGHLIGTVYPGARINLDAFEVPDAWAQLCAPAEAALRRLRAASVEEWETFVCGEQSEAEAIAARQGDLAPAMKLLNDHFDGWQPDDAPAQTGAAS